jgi:hypothetical protein
MNLLGRIHSLKFDSPNSPITILNGEFPNRYKPAFVRHRPDRITDLWKNPVTSIQVVYIPPPPLAIVQIPKGMVLMTATACIFSDWKPKASLQVLENMVFENVLRDLDSNDWVPMEFIESDKLSHFARYTVTFEKAIQGPCVILLQSEKRIAWQGVLEKNRGLARQMTEQLRDDIFTSDLS